MTEDTMTEDRLPAEEACDGPVDPAPVPPKEEEAEVEMDIYSMFKTEDSLEKKGVTLEYGSAGSFQVARAGGANEKYQKTAEAVMRPFRRLIENEMLDEKKSKALLYEIYAKSVILAWEGVKDRTGKLMPFTVENCVGLFTDLPELFADIQSFSTSGKNFKHDDIEGDAKN